MTRMMERKAGRLFSVATLLCAFVVADKAGMSCRLAQMEKYQSNANASAVLELEQ